MAPNEDSPDPQEKPEATDHDGGPSESDYDGGGSSPMTPAETLAEADCAQAFRCAARLVRMQRGTLAKCTAEVLTIVNDVLSAKDVVITDAQLLACASALAAAPCGADTPTCNFKGARTAGAQCKTAEQCQTGYCGWSGGTCPVCKDSPAPPSYANANESCAAATCAPGLGCRTSTKTCVPFAKVGEDCTDIPCDYDGGFACAKAGETGTERRCKAISFSQIGGPCVVAPSGPLTPPTLCEGSTCSTNASNTTGTCVAYLTKGSPCGTGPECGRGLVCTNGTCQPTIPDSCQ